MQNPKARFCPSCGNEKLTQDKHRFVCASCDFEFFFNVAAACAAIIEYQDKVIVTVRKHDPEKGKFDLPGGFVDKYESVEEAVAREIKEELNLEFSTLRYIGSSHNRYPYSNITYHTMDAFFVGKVDSIDNIHVEDDIEAYKLIPRSELTPDLFPFASIREGVRMYLNQCQ